MTGTDRPRRVRAFARQLSQTSATTVTAHHDSGTRWILDWGRRSGAAEVRAAAATADLGGAQVSRREIDVRQEK